MITFRKTYFSLAVVLFIIEVLIALYVRDRFVRPYLGDVLVVILIYCFVKAFIELPVLTLSICVLLFAFTIEFLQYVRIVEQLGLQQSRVARTVIGTSFELGDILAYTVGIVIVLLVENYCVKNRLVN